MEFRWPPPPSPQRPPLYTAYRWRWQVLAVVLCAEIMDLVDSTIVNIAGPSVRSDLGGGAATLQWLGAAYTLAFAVFAHHGRPARRHLRPAAPVPDRRRRVHAGLGAAARLATTPAMILSRCACCRARSGPCCIPQGFGMLKAGLLRRGDAQGVRRVRPRHGPVGAVGGPILAGFLVDSDLFGTGWRGLPDQHPDRRRGASPAPSASSPARSPLPAARLDAARHGARRRRRRSR